MAKQEKTELDGAMPTDLYDAKFEKRNTTWDDNAGIDPLLDKRITRKFDTHVVPWLFGLWLLAFIDRRYEDSSDFSLRAGLADRPQQHWQCQN